MNPHIKCTLTHALPQGLLPSKSHMTPHHTTDQHIIKSRSCAEVLIYTKPLAWARCESFVLCELLDVLRQGGSHPLGKTCFNVHLIRSVAK